MAARYLVGGYTPPHGEAGGVAVLERTSDGWGTRVLADVASPSYLARHPRLPLVYAAVEHRGEIAVVDLETGAVVQDGIAAGPAVCHVRVAGDGSSLVATCWGDGAVLRYRLDDDGRIVGREAGALAGEGSRAHLSIAVPEGFVTTDLGLDLLRVWSDGPELVEIDRVQLPAGCGPRHVVAHPNGRLYVVTEYSVEILEIDRDADGRLRLASTAPARPVARVEGDTAAEIALDPTGEWLTVGIRGSNRIAASRIHDDGSTTPTTETSSGGDRPRHHVHDAAGVLVANQSSSTVVRVPFDPATGAFGPVQDVVAVPSPTFLLPY